ncbi:DsbA family protein [Cognatishimia activa]|uniref:DsbA family protein n=1 Tax=Cognatishimia activa TaxID=1715691 RepID=UPI001FD75C8D|nr:DsbA family protein [Cognatishimia activa]
MKNALLAGLAVATLLLAAAVYSTRGQDAPNFDLASLSADEKTALRGEIRAYLLDNPEVIFEAVDIAESRQAEAQAQQDVTLVSVNAEDIFNDGYSWIGGNPEGDITLVEFVDYRCSYCRRAHDDVAELVKTDGNIRLIMKEFPILGEDSLRSSQFAIAVKQIAGDDSYKAAHDALITMRSAANEVSLSRLATTLGLDATQILAHMNSDAVREEIATTRALAQRLQISGTPSFVMQDELLRGYVPLEGMQQMVAGKRG